jgi:hypothetical protein
MATSVTKLFERSAIKLAGRVNWGQQIRDDFPGVYVVSLALLPDDENSYFLGSPPIDRTI